MPQVYELDVHGTVDKYKRGGCRCSQCTAAWSRTVPHGTVSGYISHKCRCDTCKNAKRQYELARTGRPVTALPKLQAAKGEWSLEAIKEGLALFVAKHERCPRDSEAEFLPPGRRWSAARNFAGKHGWTLRLLADDPRAHTVGFSWSREVIEGAALKYEAMTGEWPRDDAGACSDFGGRRWVTAAAWLRETHGLTLRSLKREESSSRWQEFASMEVHT